ncbi:KDGP aldolase [Paenibacillus flagellatus]|uniref:4-hydroxy-2-ketovalerate aldolase n=1 Tax=Paenibacillus flagellatus TaxID=2211139 RepID=A0A2V5K0L0_9BACL|nr:KDGP aldolase [Paenibacillus flagellatus]PYI52668.1 4-hydroxy-2-ketovalerate aldolase [Paenibacillus flagellatus]
MSGKPIVGLNVLAKDVDNAVRITEAAQGSVMVGVMVKEFASVEAAVERVEALQAAGVQVSVGLGGGDPTQWDKVVQVAVRTKPDHVNQVFPAAGYTIGALRQAGSAHTLVNALVTPAGEAGRVYVTTGPVSREYREAISCEAAAALLAEIGVHSIKLFPIEGTKRLDEVAAMVKAAVSQGITMFEPTGGIDTDTVARIVGVCAENGALRIVPHVYTSIVDPATGLTRIEDVRQLVRQLADWIG